MRIVNHIIELSTAAGMEFIDITDRIEAVLDSLGVREGIVNIQSLHTTLGILVNEAEPLLLEDFKRMLERLAPADVAYAHDDFAIRTVHMHEDESQNGHAHVRAACLPTSALLNVLGHRLQLGEWQRVFAVELDCARPRRVALQVMGE